MNRYSQLFAKLQSKQEGAFIPFVALGDPDLETSFKIIDCLIASGADALELSIPFSDPLADGPVIQNANLRAFKAGVKPQQCFELLARVRQKHPHIPMGLLMYANLVFANGIEQFYAQCQKVGVDSVLIADVPLEESAPFVAAAQQYGIAPVFICPPDADEKLIANIASKTQGYTYLLSRIGVTGTDKAPEDDGKTSATHLTDLLKKYNAAPAVQGFGISKPEQVKTAIAHGAAGAISGSAVVAIIEQYKDNIPSLLEHLSLFVKAMKAATKE